MAEMNPVKRRRDDFTPMSLVSNQPSSHVLVLNIPFDMTEGSLVHIFKDYGTVVGTKILPDGTSAIVDFMEEDMAVHLVQTAKLNNFYVGKNHTPLEFSSVSASGEPNAETKVVQFEIYNCLYQMTVDVLYAVCSPHGKVQRIFIGQKRPDNSVPAQVEFELVCDAKKAIEALHTKDIYSNCCSVSADFADCQQIFAAKNDMFSWDYTKDTDTSRITNSSNGILGEAPGYMSAPIAGNNVPAYVPGAPTGHNFFPVKNQVSQSVTGLATDYNPFVIAQGCVVFFNKLSAKINCDRLFNLVSLYGNVAKVKFLKSRPGVAMVQMGSPDSAKSLLAFLNGITIFNQQINLTLCNQPEISEGGVVATMDDGTPFMKNYIHSPNNRFRTPASIAKCRIIPPSATLHFFNAPPGLTNEELSNLIMENEGTCPDKIAIFPEKPEQKNSLGLMEWNSTSEAIEALLFANNVEMKRDDIRHPFHIKMAFSPKPINEEQLMRSQKLHEVKQQVDASGDNLVEAVDEEIE